MATCEKFRAWIDKNFILIPFLIVLLILSILYPQEVPLYPEFIDWRTVVALVGLLTIVTGIERSSYFERFSVNVLRMADTELKLSVYLVAIAVLLSMFLTNDVSLFIIVPLTLALQRFVQNDVKRIVILEAIAVNVGSTLTPIGNPQNLFIWHQWRIPFFGFVITMMPLFILLFLVLMAFCLCSSSSKRLSLIATGEKGYDKRLFALSLSLLFLFVLSIELRFSYYVLPFIFLAYLLTFRDVLKRTDWVLIFLFVVMFIDFRMIGQIGTIYEFVTSFKLSSPKNSFIFSILFSQFMSNVPASIFMSKFTDNWFAIAYGVNVGGNGTLIASLANIIALRYINIRENFVKFHKYSFLYLLITAFLTYLIFFS